jgi:Heparinase II/III-like protein
MEPQPPTLPVPTAVASLPRYPHSLAQPTQPVLTESTTHDDVESQFASHRWGFLIDSILTGAPSDTEALQRVLRWIDSQDAKHGAAWETYSACERIANLLLYLAIHGEVTSGTTPEILARFIDDSLQWIDAHLEYYGVSQTNNHLINNARALVMGGTAIGNRHAVATGLKLLRKLLPEMVLDGGFLRERSSHYQLIVTGWVLDAWRFVAHATGAESEDAHFLHGYAREMSHAARLLCNQNGLILATIGDVSPDATPAKSARRLGALYSDIAVLSQAPPAPVAVCDGWFRCERDDGIVLGNFPAGRHPLPYPHHGHSDHTAFTWTQSGAEVLVDTGRFRYTPDPVSSLQTSAHGHNVPLINGFAPLCETVLQGGLWWPRPYADSNLALKVRADGVEMEHDGFARATPVTRHIRTLTLERGNLLVLDTFEGRGSVDLELCWNFGSGLTTFDTRALKAVGAAGEVRLDIEGTTQPPDVKYITGNSPGGWHSPEYGVVAPSLGILLGWRIELPARISTRFELQTCAA